MMIRLIQRLLVLGAVLLLAACAGTIQRETNAGPQRIAGATYTGVDVVLTDDARRLQADNPQFSVRELSDYVRRRLEARDLLSEQGTHRVEVTIETFRVRSAAAAVLLGIMAGTDQIDGFVRVYDARGRQVHGYKVAASYGLGGWGGGQDGTRMTWLYDKFSELTVAELGGTTDARAIAKGHATTPPAPRTAVSITPAPASARAAEPARPVVASTAIAPAAPVRAGSIASGYAAIDDLDAIPYLSERGRKDYDSWLKLPLPRAFAISPTGHYWHTSTVRPKDPTLPVDPSERALLMCERNAQRPCKLYAVNNAVVWVKEASPLAGEVAGATPAPRP